jgi:hypothetical protein
MKFYVWFSNIGFSDFKMKKDVGFWMGFLFALFEKKREILIFVEHKEAAFSCPMLLLPPLWEKDSNRNMLLFSYTPFLFLLVYMYDNPNRHNGASLL